MVTACKLLLNSHALCGGTLQDPGILQRLQHTVAASDDIFLMNFRRWHYTNCRGLQAEGYKKSLYELGTLYQVSHRLKLAAN
jgi:hypothetical protein